jgi:mono/diheme cytochrome c family protein
VLLASCGGGGGSSSDTVPGAPVVPSAITGSDRFLLFPNPQVLSDGTFETDTVAYAEAYYAAIDPTNAKDTLPKWIAANGFGTAAGALGEVHATFGDMHDLGYGRQMTARQNADGTVAVYVNNYLVTAGVGYTYSPLNLEAAVLSDTRWHVGTNAIEYSPGPGGAVNFVKFYTFDPTPPYARRLVANLDGRGNKAMPGICINCHGGRADPLTPTDLVTGKPLFPLVQNSASQKRGDVTARMQMFKVDSLDFSPIAGYTRADLEATMKTMNKMILCTYPLVAPSALAEDGCRTAAPTPTHEWEGTADEVIKAAYGGPGMPNAAFDDTDTTPLRPYAPYVPTLWVGQTSLYRNVTHQVCMTCHMLRGTANQSDLNFMTYAKFEGYSDRIKAHVIDRGNMPLAKIVSERFWAGSMPATLATWLDSLGLGYIVRDSALAVLRPGRPVADPGPGRTVNFGPTTLSAAMSLYATTYSWSITSNPGGSGVLTNPTSSTPSFSASSNGTYVLQLIVGNGTTQSDPVSLTLIVNNALSPVPTAIRFADIKAVLQANAGSNGCTTCHTAAPVGGQKPPILYTSDDRNGDSLFDATDDAWFYKELRGRINFTDIVASPLLRKPSGNHHNGAQRPGFDTSLAPGAAGRANYDLFLNWILNGAPE